MSAHTEHLQANVQSAIVRRRLALAAWHEAVMAFSPRATPAEMAAAIEAEADYIVQTATCDDVQLAYCEAVVAEAKQAGRL